MFAFLKAVVLGAIFGFVLSELIGHGGGDGGILNIRHFMLDGYHLAWSWMLFVAGTALAFVILLMMD